MMVRKGDVLEMQIAKKTDKRPLIRKLGRDIPEGNLLRIARYAAYVYIGLPIIIFLLGWIRPYIAIPLALAVLASFFLCFRSISRAPIEGGGTVPRSFLVVMLLLTCVWVYLSGIGGYVSQTTDHYYRNEMFKILVDYSWPPAKTLPVGTGYRTMFFCYYLGFWLPAALVAKLFGIECGFAFQYIWSVAGLCILFVLLSGKIKKWRASTIFLFAFFSGLDIIGCVLAGVDVFSMSLQEHIEWWSGLQYSSHSTQLFWVFNQAIYGWLLTMLILSEEDNRRLVLIWSCGLLECTFPFVGMLPFLAHRIIHNALQSGANPKNLFKWTNGLFSIENILGGGVIGIVSFLYLFGNSASLSSNAGFSTRPADVYVFLLFILLEAGVFFIAIFPYQKKNPLFWVALISLVLIPTVHIGGGQDFCMRASIPSLMVLCVLLAETMHTAWGDNRRRFYAMLALFLIGAVTPMHEIIRASVWTFSARSSGGDTRTFVEEDDVFSSPNFNSLVDASLFAKYFTNLKAWEYGGITSSGNVIGELTDDRLVEQRFSLPEDVTIGSICALFGTYVRTNNCRLSIVIVDDTGKASAVGAIDCSKLQDNAVHFVDILPYEIQKDRWYTLQIVAKGAEPGNAVTIYQSTDTDEDLDRKYAVLDGEKQAFSLAIAFGEREVTKNEGSPSRRRLRHAYQ